MSVGTAADVWELGDPRYPESLTTIASPPKSLYAVGSHEVLGAPCVAIVGTRHPTPYGERVARELAQAVARHGGCVVSGMALGIDGVAHRAALQAGGRTAAVLGAGVDEVYPPQHAALYDALARDGVILSEYPPGTKAFHGCFPRRNRIIAGLAAVTIVVEAGHKSGALITANYATDFGRTVAAVPGPIDARQSQGSNQLLRDGANVIAAVDDVIMLMGLAAPTAPLVTSRDVSRSRARSASTHPHQPRSPQTPPVLHGDDATVWEAIGTGTTADDLIARTGLPADRCMVAITTLEVRGLVECLLTGEIQRR